MRENFPQEEYKKMCGRLSPSQTSLEEILSVKKTGKAPKRRYRTLTGAAACVLLVCTMSVGAAAADGDIISDMAAQVSVWFRGITIDNEASTPYETVAYTEDGTQISVVHGSGENGKYYVTLIYHEDSKRLGVKVGENETDITDQLIADGSYTQDYTYEGKSCRLTVTGPPENASLQTEVLE